MVEQDCNIYVKNHLICGGHKTAIVSAVQTMGLEKSFTLAFLKVNACVFSFTTYFYHNYTMFPNLESTTLFEHLLASGHLLRALYKTECEAIKMEHGNRECEHGNCECEHGNRECEQACLSKI